MAANGSSLQWTGGGGPNAGLATESSFNSRDFDKFKISGDVSLTFGLRELKARHCAQSPMSQFTKTKP